MCELCVNDYGTFHCECPEGRYLGPDNKTCYGELENNDLMIMINDLDLFSYINMVYRVKL